MSSWYSSFHRWQLDHYRVRVCVACLVLAVVWEVSAAGKRYSVGSVLSRDHSMLSSFLQVARFT